MRSETNLIGEYWIPCAFIPLTHSWVKLASLELCNVNVDTTKDLGRVTCHFLTLYINRNQGCYFTVLVFIIAFDP